MMPDRSIDKSVMELLVIANTNRDMAACWLNG